MAGVLHWRLCRCCDAYKSIDNYHRNGKRQRHECSACRKDLQRDAYLRRKQASINNLVSMAW